MGISKQAIFFLHFLFLFAYVRFVLFVRVKSFSKKKIKKLKSALVTSFTLLLLLFIRKTYTKGSCSELIHKKVNLKHFTKINGFHE